MRGSVHFDIKWSCLEALGCLQSAAHPLFFLPMCVFPGVGMDLGTDPTHGRVSGSWVLGMGLPKSAFP